MEIEWYPIETGDPRREGEEGYIGDALLAAVTPKDGGAVLTVYIDGRFPCAPVACESVEAAKERVERKFA